MKSIFQELLLNNIEHINILSSKNLVENNK